MINTKFRTIKFLENGRDDIQNFELHKEILDLTTKAWSINEKKSYNLYFIKIRTFAV